MEQPRVTKLCKCIAVIILGIGIVLAPFLEEASMSEKELK